MCLLASPQMHLQKPGMPVQCSYFFALIHRRIHVHPLLSASKQVLCRSTGVRPPHILADEEARRKEPTAGEKVGTLTCRPQTFTVHFPSSRSWPSLRDTQSPYRTAESTQLCGVTALDNQSNAGLWSHRHKWASQHGGHGGERACSAETAAGLDKIAAAPDLGAPGGPGQPACHDQGNAGGTGWCPPCHFHVACCLLLLGRGVLTMVRGSVQGCIFNSFCHTHLASNAYYLLSHKA